MTRSTPYVGSAVGAIRYGPSSATGPDPASAWLARTPADLGSAPCLEIHNGRDAILAAASRFSAEQKAALAARVAECGAQGIPGLIGGAGEYAARSALGDTGILGGVADVIGNSILALAGVALIVLGLGRVFGVGPGDVAGRLPGR